MENLNQETPNNTPIIRIAPVYNGKIYVIPHTDSHHLDLPMMEQADCHPIKSSNKQARQLTQKHESFLHTEEHPRFSVKYLSPVKKEEQVYLYILPLTSEKDINFEDGQFISADEIDGNGHLYSDYLQKESGLLGMAAELWNDYL